MGNFTRSTALIAKNLIRQTPEHLSVRGGVKKQAEIIETVSEELGKYLGKFKRKHITTEQLQEYYHEVFPELKIKINGSRPEKFPMSKRPTAVTGLPYEYGEFKGNFEIDVHSDSLFDKIKNLFGKKNNDRYFVNSRFVDALVHENTHVMQMYMKSSDKIYQQTLRRIAENKSTEFARLWYNHAKQDCGMSYGSFVYKEEWPLLFSKKRFMKRIYRSQNLSYLTNDMKKANIKAFIQMAEGEKQAYIMGELNKLRFRFPKLAEKPFFHRLFERKASRTANAFEFDRKIEAMKQEYLKMIEAERPNLPAYNAIS